MRVFASIAFSVHVATALVPASAKANTAAIAACPGQSLTLSHLAGKVNASTRVCMKMVSALDGKPTAVEFWKIGTFGQVESLGTKEGAACFDYSVSVAGRQELRAGGFKSSTVIYMVELDSTRGLRTPFDDHDYLLANLKVPPPDYYKTALDPCRPRCEQVPAPRLGTNQQNAGCYAACNNSGNWTVVCENYDPKTGKKRPPP